jgi:hypothetical protein
MPVPGHIARRVPSPARPWTYTALLLVVLAILGLSAFTFPAWAQSSLETEISAPLTGTQTPLTVTLSAVLEEPWPGTTAVVEVKGPGSPKTDPDDWVVSARVEQAAGDLAAGEAVIRMTIPAEDLVEPGAYFLSVGLVGSEGGRLGSENWCGRLSSNPGRFEVAMVLPVAFGIRRDPEGVFVDSVVQDSVIPESDRDGSLYAIFGAIEDNPDWHLTLGIEPLFLAELRDLIDGYSEYGDGGDLVEVPAGEGAGPYAEQALAALRSLSALETVHVIPAPYALPALPVLAREGWDDGFGQMQLGKAELQSTLELPVVPDGAYAPGLEVTTDTLGAFSQASIDYAVVRADVARDLAEAPAGGDRRPIRVQDRDNDRLTLLLADEELRAAMGSPWDVDRFAAALAATVARGEPGLIVAAPADEYDVPPAAYIREIGELLTGESWVRTLTLDEVVSESPPETRPIFLSRYGGYVESYVGRAYLEGLRTAHQAVRSLTDAAGTVGEPLDDLVRKLFEAESHYWFVAGLDPRVANLGLSLLASIDETVAAEFDKVDVAGDKSVIVVGGEGEVPVAIVNQTGYTLDVRVEVTGEGVEVRDGGNMNVTLGPQENIFTVPISVSAGNSDVVVRVLAGDMLVDEGTVRIRSVAIGPVVAWAVLILALLALIAYALLRFRR